VEQRGILRKKAQVLGIGDVLADIAGEMAIRFARQMIRQHLPAIDRQIAAMEVQTKRQKKEAKQRRADKRRKDVVNLPGGVQYFPPTKKGSPRK